MKSLLFSTLLLAGLSAPLSAARPADKAPRGTCYVCKYNNDLSCVNFRLKPETPKAAHQGQTYVFCGEDCRTAFMKHPTRYLPRK